MTVSKLTKHLGYFLVLAFFFEDFFFAVFFWTAFFLLAPNALAQFSEYFLLDPERRMVIVASVIEIVVFCIGIVLAHLLSSQVVPVVEIRMLHNCLRTSEHSRLLRMQECALLFDPGTNDRGW